jgi:hypothetical protein
MEKLAKFSQLFIFGLVTVLFVPLFLIIYFGQPYYEKWFEKIMEL